MLKFTVSSMVNPFYVWFLLVLDTQKVACRRSYSNLNYLGIYKVLIKIYITIIYSRFLLNNYSELKLFNKEI